MKDLWDRFEKWIHENAKPLKDGLNPGASDDDIKKLEALIGDELPQDFKASLKIHNGQKRNAGGIIELEELLSTDRIIEEWTVWKDLLDSGTFENSQSQPASGVKDDWWNAKWIPITYDGSGNHYCIDLDPENEENSGQIIRMWHDSAERELFADSFGDFLNKYVECLEGGTYLYSEDWYGILHQDDV